MRSKYERLPTDESCTRVVNTETAGKSLFYRFFHPVEMFSSLILKPQLATKTFSSVKPNPQVKEDESSVPDLTTDTSSISSSPR